MNSVHFELSSPQHQPPLCAEVQYNAPNVRPVTVVLKSLAKVLPVKIISCTRLSRIHCRCHVRERCRYRLELDTARGPIGFLLTVDS